MKFHLSHMLTEILVMPYDFYLFIFWPDSLCKGFVNRAKWWIAFSFSFIVLTTI